MTDIQLFKKLIADICTRGRGYKIEITTVTASVAPYQPKERCFKIEAQPLSTGAGVSITVSENANIFEVLKTIELRLH